MAATEAGGQRRRGSGRRGASPAKGVTPERRGERGEASQRLGSEREGATAAGDGVRRWRQWWRGEGAEERAATTAAPGGRSTVLPSSLSRGEKKGDGGKGRVTAEGDGLAGDRGDDDARAVRHGSGLRERGRRRPESPSGVLSGDGERQEQRLGSAGRWRTADGGCSTAVGRGREGGEHGFKRGAKVVGRRGGWGARALQPYAVSNVAILGTNQPLDEPNIFPETANKLKRHIESGKTEFPIHLDQAKYESILREVFPLATSKPHKVQEGTTAVSSDSSSHVVAAAAAAAAATAAAATTAATLEKVQIEQIIDKAKQDILQCILQELQQQLPEADKSLEENGVTKPKPQFRMSMLLLPLKPRKTSRQQPRMKQRKTRHQ
ncbi:hypothetical protein OsJ_17764 [Oryza sativa Japonica Group]|uniref:Uncharacterized protein n=1 Tax=Oryza sativa subsp. japonica TaxID=39947 RepID=B9FNF9_ORYSJ|nr:hypothetical protein OsJ_17764 [Oryza sativa Japonica Group]